MLFKNYIRVIVIVVTLFLNLSATEIAVKQGWNLISLPAQMRLNSDEFNSTFHKSYIKILWKYSQSSWSVYAPDKNSSSFENFSDIDSSEGFWLLSTQDANLSVMGENFNSTFEQKIEYAGDKWLLLGTPSNIMSDANLSSSNIQIVWAYKDNIWSAYSPIESIQTTLDSFNFAKIESLKSGDGFWVALLNVITNHTPIAQAFSFTCNEDSLYKNVLNATDAEKDTLTFSAVNQPLHGSLSLDANGSFSYLPNPNFNGNDLFEYYVSDGVNTSVIQTVSIIVNPQNDVPVASLKSFTSSEDINYSDSFNAIDIDDLNLTYSITANPVHGTVSIDTNGAFTYSPNANYNGSDSFTYKVTDAYNASVTQDVNITILAVNDTVIPTFKSFSTNEDSAYNGVMSGDNVDNTPLTFSITKQPVNGTISNFDANSGAFIYTPNANYTGSDIFKYAIYDGIAYSLVQSVIITVTAVNDAPIGIFGSITIPEDSSYSNFLSASDSDGDKLFTYGALTTPQHGTFSLQSNGYFTYTANQDYSGVDSFSYYVKDDKNASSSPKIVDINITQVNDAPVATFGSFTTPEGTLYKGTLSASDAENDTVTFVKVTQASHGNVTINSATGVFTYTPTNYYNGFDSFTYKANDGALDSVVKKVNITITNVNNKPVATYSTPVTLTEDTQFSGTLSATDLDNDALSFSKVGDASHGTLFIDSNGSFTYTPSVNFNGEDSFSYKVNDGTLDSDAKVVALTINNDNADKPSITNFTGSVDEGSPADTFIGMVTISEGDSAITSVELNGSGSTNFVLESDGKLKVAAGATLDYETITKYTLSATATNSVGTSTSASIVIDINNTLDTKPTIGNLSVNIDENSAGGVAVGSLSITLNGTVVSAIDLIGEGNQSFSVDKYGAITVAQDASLDYEKKSTYSLNAIAHSDGGDSNLADVTITINNLIDSPPILEDFNTSVDENITEGTLIGKITANKGDATKINSFALSDTSVFQITSNGSIILKLGASLDFETTPFYHLTATATSTLGTSEAVDVNISLNNIGPSFLASSFDVYENLTFVTNKIAKESTSYAISGSDAALFSIDNNGTLSFKNPKDYESDSHVYNLTVDVSDGDTNLTSDIVVNLLDSNASRLTKIVPQTQTSQYGSSVSMEDKSIVVTSPYEDTTYIYKFNQETQKWDSKSVDSLYGSTSAINANTLVIGAPDKQSIYIYDKSNDWNKTQTIIGSIDSKFGRAVAVADDTLAVLSKNTLYIYMYNGGSWVIKKTIATGVSLGTSLSLSKIGDKSIILIGAPNYSSSETSGRVLLYETDDSWNSYQTKTLLQPGGAKSNSFFGQSVSLYGDKAVIGAPGDATAYYYYGFNYNNADDIWEWGSSSAITLPATVAQFNNYFGSSVKMYNDKLVIGAKYHSVYKKYDGALFYFTKSGSSWTYNKTIIGSDGLEKEYLGQSDQHVAINDNGLAYSMPNRFQDMGVYFYDFINKGEQKPLISKSEFSIYEGQKSIGYVFNDRANAHTPSKNSVSITGGDDATKATINTTTKLLSLSAVPDFESANDTGTDHTYQLSLSSSNDVGTTTADINITVLNSSIEYNQTLVLGTATENIGLASVSRPLVYAVSGSNNKVYIYNYNGTSWVQTILSESVGSNDIYGYSLALNSSGTKLAVGVYNNSLKLGEQPNGGSVFVYEYLGSSWSKKAEIPKDISDEVHIPQRKGFGYDIAIDGDFLAVSDPAYNTYDGRVSIYKRGASSWDFVQNINGASSSSEKLGSSLSMNGEYLLIGAPWGNSYKGNSYLYKSDGSNFSHLTTFSDSSASGSGESVLISANKLYIGAPSEGQGTVYVYTKSGEWSNTVTPVKITQSDNESLGFGTKLSANDDYLFVGAPQSFKNGVKGGAVYMYDTATWSEKTVPFGAAPLGYFGNSISFDGNNSIIVGAPGEFKNAQGALYIYNF